MTADLRNNAARNNHTAHTYCRERDKDVHDAQVVRGGDGDGAAEGGHHGGGDDHDELDAAAGEWDGEQGDDGAADDAEADGERADADADGVVAVDVVDFGGPEEEEDEELGWGISFGD